MKRDRDLPPEEDFDPASIFSPRQMKDLNETAEHLNRTMGITAEQCVEELSAGITSMKRDTEGVRTILFEMERWPMKRDMELIRNILLEVESWPAGEPRYVEIAGEDAARVRHHVSLLVEGEFLRATDVSTMGSPDTYLVDRLSWKGSEFLDEIRSPTVWRRVTARLVPLGGSVAIPVLREIAIAEGKRLLGLAD